MLTFSINESNYDRISKLENGFEAFNVRTDLGREWLGTAYIAAAEGNFDGGTKVDYYAKTCELNRNMSKSKREVNLINTEEIQEGGSSFHAVSDVVASYVDSNIDELIERTEYKYNVEQFIDMHEYIALEEKLNLFSVLKLSLRSDKTAMNLLGEVSEKYGLFDILKVIIKNSECFNMLNSAWERGLLC